MFMMVDYIRQITVKRKKKSPVIMANVDHLSSCSSSCFCFFIFYLLPAGVLVWICIAVLLRRIMKNINMDGSCIHYSFREKNSSCAPCMSILFTQSPFTFFLPLM